MSRKNNPSKHSDENIRDHAGSADFTPFSENEMAAVMGGREDMRPQVILPQESDNKNSGLPQDDRN